MLVVCNGQKSSIDLDQLFSVRFAYFEKVCTNLNSSLSFAMVVSSVSLNLVIIQTISMAAI